MNRRDTEPYVRWCGRTVRFQPSPPTRSQFVKSYAGKEHHGFQNGSVARFFTANSERWHVPSCHQWRADLEVRWVPLEGKPATG